MEQNKTGKYLKYAIGEIILVVLGILIALQINTWNEGRKDRILEDTYLLGIKEDFQKDFDYLIEIGPQLLVNIQRQKKLDSLYRNKTLKKEDVLKLRMGNLRRAPTTFMTTAGNYKSLVSEGKSSLIQNKELFNKIQTIYERNYTRMREFQYRIDDRSDKIIWHHRENYNWRDLSIDEIIESGIITDIKIHYSDINVYYNIYMRDIKIELKEIIRLIEIELTND